MSEKISLDSSALKYIVGGYKAWWHGQPESGRDRKSPQVNCELFVVRPGFEPEFPP